LKIIKLARPTYPIGGLLKGQKAKIIESETPPEVKTWGELSGE
jgi:hypothetical protein